MSHWIHLCYRIKLSNRKEADCFSSKFAYEKNCTRNNEFELELARRNFCERTSKQDENLYMPQSAVEWIENKLLI